ncbi:MAG: sulfatase-like hydrolase/transferase [Planctomycetota bacterium]
MFHARLSSGFFAIVLVLAATSSGLAAGKQPDILLIMADDVGIEGLGCYGGASYNTPNLDALAADGVRFTHAYAQPLCTPTRVQLMTGKYNHRNWRYFGILDPSEQTFGHAMKSAGYTTGIFGKWQLQSYDPPDLPGAEERRGTGMHPKDAGFDEYALFHALHTEDKGSRYANPTMLEGKAAQPGEAKTYEGRYGEDVWVAKILDFLDRNEGEPRFVYYPMALPHWPFEPTPQSPEWNPRATPEADLEFADDMIEYMDVVVGRLMDELRARQLERDTIVIFYSDNGTHLKVTSKMRDGRAIAGGKAMPTQTGIHVPLIVHCPNRYEPKVANGIVDASDFWPTLLELAGAKPNAAESERDGVSFVSQLQGTPGPRRDAAFFWYDPRPGWDKERFTRHVFALNKTHKYFRDGRLFRFSDTPLEETLVSPSKMSAADRANKQQLAEIIRSTMSGVNEPPLVDAYGKPMKE